MNTAYIYLQLYKLFDDITPVPVDCGQLCDKACCKGDDSGMFLFPGEKEVFNKNGHDPSPEEIAKELDLPKEDVVFALDAIADPVSLFEPIYHDGGEAIYVMDQVKDTKNVDENWLENIALSEAMKHLDEREKHILNLRFFQSRTQMEVAEEIGISQAQVSRLEKSALKQLRKYV